MSRTRVTVVRTDRIEHSYETGRPRDDVVDDITSALVDMGFIYVEDEDGRATRIIPLQQIVTIVVRDLDDA